jgi:hypothetical protein
MPPKGRVDRLEEIQSSSQATEWPRLVSSHHRLISVQAIASRRYRRSDIRPRLPGCISGKFSVKILRCVGDENNEERAAAVDQHQRKMRAFR